MINKERLQNLQQINRSAKRDCDVSVTVAQNLIARSVLPVFA
jgi:hypothetical protein